jgi:hypothetical protein
MNKTKALKQNPKLKYPRPTAKDRANYAQTGNPQYRRKPDLFLKLGQRVRARFRIFDLPGQTKRRPDGTVVTLKTNWGWLTAPKGMEGTVVDKCGGWPTVRFDNGLVSDVTDVEVEPI